MDATYKNSIQLPRRMLLFLFYFVAFFFFFGMFFKSELYTLGKE